MMKKNINKIIISYIYLLIPLILYGIYKNGYLIYQKDLINIVSIFKPLYLVIISIGIKLLIDIIKDKSIKIDYNLIYVILIAMIMPYNINLILYIVLFSILYVLFLYIERYIKINKVVVIYLIIVIINFIINGFTYLTPLEENYSFSFSFLDFLQGRNIGGISTTSIILSLVAFVFLINNYYYKKDIPITINISYLILAFIYFLITNNSEYLLNSELIFSSIFIATLPMYSPYKVIHQIIYGLAIGILSFIITILFNSILAIYISMLVVSILCIIFNKKMYKTK